MVCFTYLRPPVGPWRIHARDGHLSDRPRNRQVLLWRRNGTLLQPRCFAQSGSCAGTYRSGSWPARSYPDGPSAAKERRRRIPTTARTSALVYGVNLLHGR